MDTDNGNDRRGKEQKELQRPLEMMRSGGLRSEGIAERHGGSGLWWIK